MGFGEKVDINNPIRELMRVSPSLVSPDVALLMRDRYETTYGIYNHDAPMAGRELALVGMHPKEDVTTTSLLRERIREFGKREVFKHTGVSLTEFMEFPPDVCQMIFETAAEMAKDTGKMAQEVLDEMGKGKP